MSKDVALPGREVEPISRDIIREMAMDIGKEVASHIETMYPDAVKATSKTMLRSVRNTVFNEIIAAIQLNDEGKIVERLDRRKQFRRRQRAAWKKIREKS